MEQNKFTKYRQILFTTKEAARMMGLNPGTLARWRVQGTGPQYIKMKPGHTVRYLEKDISEFLASRHCSSTSQK